MGLDSYLFSKQYMSTLKMDDTAPDSEEVIQAKQILELFPELTNINPDQERFNSVTVTVDLGYWRKANHIHKWFVDHIQGGVDECQDSYVERENLAELLATCKAVMADKSKASELLPTSSGFFFGSTGYDEWYFEQVEYTITLIENIFKANGVMDIYYHGSW